MTIQELKTEIDKLSLQDQYEIAGDLWDKLESETYELDLSDELKQKLQRRLEDYHKNPESGISWEELNARLEAMLTKSPVE